MDKARRKEEEKRSRLAVVERALRLERERVEADKRNREEAVLRASEQQKEKAERANTLFGA